MFKGTKLQLVPIMFIGLMAVSLGLWLSTVAADRPHHPLGQGKPTPVTPFPTPDPNETPVVVETKTAVVGPISPLPTQTSIPDNMPPNTVVQFAGQHAGYNWYRSPVTVTFNVIDNLTGLGIIEYKIDGATDWTQREYYHPPVIITGEGTHTITYRAIDKLSNTETAKSATVNIDLTPPNPVTYTLDGLYILNGWYGSPVTLNLSAGQDTLSGLDHYEINLNGRGWLPVSTTTVISDTGNHTLELRAIDRAGNPGPAEFISLDVDTTPPTTTHTISSTHFDDGRYTVPVTISLTAMDIGAGVFQILYRLDGGPAWWIYGGPFEVNTKGNHTLEYYATDRANNIEPKHTVTFNVEGRKIFLPIILKP